MAAPAWTMRRLTREDAAAFHALRLEGFTAHPEQFRVAPEDEADLPLTSVAERLASQFVLGAWIGEELVGIGGLSRFDGAKLRHRALLWGMYVRASGRGTGLADAIVEALLAEARAQGIAQVILTVAAANTRAQRLYGRWGFEVYGMEPGAIRVGDRDLDETLMVCRLS